MHIVWMILKIIGILLLVVIGMVLALLLAVLFVPVRYRIQVDKETTGVAKVHAGVGWLLRIIYVSVRYEEELQYCVRIFGIPLIRSKSADTEEAVSETTETEKKDTKRKAKLHKTNKKKKREKTISDEKVSWKEKSGKALYSQEQDRSEIEASMNDRNESEQSKTIIESTTESTEKSIVEPLEEDTDPAAELEKAYQEHQQEEEKKSRNPFTKLKAFWKKICDGICSMIYKCKNLWQNIKAKKFAISEKLRVIIEFWNGPENQAGKQLILSTGKKLFTHIFPQKWKGKIRFGLEDPGATGKALAVLSILYGLIENMPEIIPDFEKEVLEGHFFCKGRIQVFFLVRHIWHMWFHEDFKRVKKNFEKARRAF